MNLYYFNKNVVLKDEERKYLFVVMIIKAVGILKVKG